MDNNNKSAMMAQMPVNAKPQEQGVIEAPKPTAEGGIGQQVNAEASSANINNKVIARTIASRLLGNEIVDGIMDANERTIATKHLQSLGYIDQDGKATDALKKKLNKLLRLSEKDKINAKLKAVYLASELLSAGYQFCYDRENREVHNAHIDELYERVADDKAKCFFETGKVCWATDALKQGRKIYDYNGNELTEETPGIEKYILILDMQHRWAVILEHPEIDVYLDFIDTTTIDIAGYIDNLNNGGLKWDGSDVKHALKSQYSGKVDALNEISRFQSYFSVTEKYSEIVITREKDKFRLSDMKDLQSGKNKFDEDKFKVSADTVETGWNIMYATSYMFGKEKKVRKIEWPLALYNVAASLTEKDKKDFNRNVLNFIIKLDGQVKLKIIEKIEAKDTLKLNAYVMKLYNTFVQDNSEGMAAITADVEQIIQAKKAEMDKEKATEGSVKKLKTGSISSILSNRAALRKQKENKEAEKNTKANKTK